MTIYLNPYRRLSNFRQAMDRLFEDEFANTPDEREMALALDVQAGEDDYVIKALVPGLDADDLNIEILNNTVSVRGEFKGNGQEDEKFLMNELPAGKFGRVITLPTALDPAKAEANIKNGLLVLRVPKAEAHRPKTIKINAG